MPHHGNNRAGGHVLHEGREERLGHEVLVVLLEKSLVCTGACTTLAICFTRFVKGACEQRNASETCSR
jgi:hypothetical protein